MLADISPERKAYWRGVFDSITERKKLHDHLLHLDHIYEEYIYPLEREAERREQERERIEKENSLRPVQVNIFDSEKFSLQ